MKVNIINNFQKEFELAREFNFKIHFYANIRPLETIDARDFCLERISSDMREQIWIGPKFWIYCKVRISDRRTITNVTHEDLLNLLIMEGNCS